MGCDQNMTFEDIILDVERRTQMDMFHLTFYINFNKINQNELTIKITVSCSTQLECMFGLK